MDTQNEAIFEAGDYSLQGRGPSFWYLLAKFPGWEKSKMSCTLSGCAMLSAPPANLNRHISRTAQQKLMTS